MIIEYLFTMWVELYTAGYRPIPKMNPNPESWQDYIKRVKVVIAEFKEEKNGR